MKQRNLKIQTGYRRQQPRMPRFGVLEHNGEMLLVKKGGAMPHRTRPRDHRKRK